MSYKPLKWVAEGDEQDSNFDEKLPYKRSTGSGYRNLLTTALIVALLLSNAFLLWRQGHLSASANETVPYWGSTERVDRTFYWATEYANEDKDVTNPLWEGLFPPGDGLVSLDDDWAASQSLPSSFKRFRNTTNTLYFVAAYHQLHCLAVIRQTLYHLKEDRPLLMPFMHATHCLDSLRQSTMCHADDTLLYTVDTHTYGDGQPRQCRDWDALARWTEENRIYVERFDGPTREGRWADAPAIQ